MYILYYNCFSHSISFAHTWAYMVAMSTPRPCSSVYQRRNRNDRPKSRQRTFQAFEAPLADEENHLVVFSAGKLLLTTPNLSGKIANFLKPCLGHFLSPKHT